MKLTCMRWSWSVLFISILILIYALVTSGKDIMSCFEQGTVFASEIPRLKAAAAGISEKSDIQIHPEPLFNNIRLAGTVTSDNRVFNLAIIESKNERRQAVYNEGSRLPEASIITNIFSDHILLEKNGEKSIIKFTGGPVFYNEIDAEGYKRVSATEWIVNPDAFFNSTGDIALICQQTKISPCNTGLKIDKLPDDKFLRELGLLEGDIIEQINGYQFNRLYAALNYLWNIKDGSAINMTIIRQGHKVQLTYHPYYDTVKKYKNMDTIAPYTLSNMLTIRHTYTRNNILYK